MLRLELQAEVANLQAEADALLADADLEGEMLEAAPQAPAATAVVEEVGETTTDAVDGDVAVETESPNDEGRQPA